MGDNVDWIKKNKWPVQKKHGEEVQDPKKIKWQVYKVEKTMYEAAYRHDESKSIYNNRKLGRVIVKC